MKTYAEIIVNSDVLDIDKPFTYEVTEEFEDDIKQGQLVKVPFGVRNNPTDGFVLRLKYEDDIKGMRIKKVKKISFIEPVLTNDDLSLIEFLRDTYLCKYIDAIRLLIPQGILKGTKNKRKKVIIWIKDLLDKISEDKYGEIVNYIKNNNGSFTKAELTKEKGLSLYKINKLIEEGYLGSQEEIVYRYNNREYTDYGEKKLTDEQFMAIEKIKASNNKLYLLKGVTGSGKTEVYMKLVEETIRLGNSAIVLVPEIALTPQMIERFKGRFGKDVALFHSRLSDGERHDEWHRVRDGNAKLIIGARSALFLPVKNLGLIIIDEEHENTYKSEHNPKYQTREVAEFLSELKGCKVILGSATPSIESYYRAISGKMKLIELNNRVDKKPMPEMEIVDMRKELKSGNMSIFSRDLYSSVNEALSKNEQIVLFLNRRGFSTFVSCRGCGYVFKCPECDISMTYHKNGFLVCHYCGKSAKQPKICPKCESKYVKFFGSGTEKVEDEVRRCFPKAKVLRMDVDTTRAKNSHENIYNAFKNGEGNILIGTQMISKGLDFPNVTLVGIIAADISINIPDYRSAEKTFQIITQVGGRAGRGEKEGKVIIQTYTPDYYGLIYAKNYDYEGFYDEEFAIRGLMGYPPFGKLLLINAICKNEQQLNAFMNNLAIELKKISNKYIDVNMLGPVPCIITKIRESYRWQILFKGELSQEFCKKIKDRLYEFNKNVYNEIRVSIDINPNNLT
ncbi:MAG: primosomal protein N' [Clostridium sp.]